MFFALSTSYEGNLQKVCVADTGFDQGKMVDELGIQVHPALSGRVERLGSLWLEDSKDISGHRTHVCASVCGNGLYKTGDARVRGLAPGATLMVQSIATISKDPNKDAIEVPMDLVFSYSHNLMNSASASTAIRGVRSGTRRLATWATRVKPGTLTSSSLNTRTLSF